MPTGRGRPRKPRLRRAISTAYYATFAALTVEVARHYPAGAARLAVRRLVSHAAARRACEDLQRTRTVPWLHGNPPCHPELLAFATNFESLYILRHLADYDHDYSCTKLSRQSRRRGHRQATVPGVGADPRAFVEALVPSGGRPSKASAWVSSRGRRSRPGKRLASFGRPTRRRAATATTGAQCADRRSSRPNPRRGQPPSQIGGPRQRAPAPLPVISTTVTISRTSMTSGRVRTSTGRRLRPTSAHHTSPRFIRPPTLLRRPRSRRAAPDTAGTPHDPTHPWPV